MKNYLLKVGQASSCGLGSVHPIYVFINTFFIPSKSCNFLEQL
jgi:hypothetical protein